MNVRGRGPFFGPSSNVATKLTPASLDLSCGPQR
jgi:hypothetical protein